MSSRLQHRASGVRRLAPDDTDATLAGLAGAARLAELTHLPGGVPSGQFETVELGAGDTSPSRTSGAGETLLHVVAGRARVEWGPELGSSVLANAGDTLVVSAGEAFRTANPSGSEPLQLLLIRSA